MYQAAVLSGEKNTIDACLDLFHELLVYVFKAVLVILAETIGLWVLIGRHVVEM